MTPAEMSHVYHILALERTIREGSRVMGADNFTIPYLLDECGSKGIIERGLQLAALGEVEVSRLMEWVVGFVDIELAYSNNDGKLFDLLQGWIAQARMRMDGDRHRDALVALDLVELANTRLQLVTKLRLQRQKRGGE